MVREGHPTENLSNLKKWSQKMKLERSEFMARHKVKSALLMCGLMSLVMLSGCAIGPKAYKSSFEGFNDEIELFINFNGFFDGY